MMFMKILKTHPRNNLARSQTRSLYFCLLLLTVLILPSCVSKTASRDALWNTISTCIDMHAPGYCDICQFPRVESACASGRDCGNTTEIWEETEEFFAMRDRKMCGCGADFLHGLIVPLSRVTGVEDPKRPDNIWGFAWTVAKKRIVKEDDIALAVNPPGIRSQDQLHIHIVRLRDNARKDFDDKRSERIEALDNVWKASARRALQAGLKEYGIIVVRHSEGGFLLVVDEKNTEKAYTLWNCR